MAFLRRALSRTLSIAVGLWLLTVASSLAHSGLRRPTDWRPDPLAIIHPHPNPVVAAILKALSIVVLLSPGVILSGCLLAGLLHPLQRGRASLPRFLLGLIFGACIPLVVLCAGFERVSATPTELIVATCFAAGLVAAHSVLTGRCVSRARGGA
jgi:hypothetical protein